MPFNFRSQFDAFLALAIGTAAGWFVLNAFGMPSTQLTFVFKQMKGLFDVFRSYAGGEIALVVFVYRVPGILVTGLLIGLILPRVRHRQFLLCSILLWPAYVVLRKLLSVFLLEVSGREAGRHGLGILFLQTNAGPEIIAYIVQYTLLFLILFATSALVKRVGQHNLSLNTGRA